MADSTLDYWNQVRILWKECDINLAMALQGNTDTANQFQVIADIWRDCSKRFRGFSLLNVDGDLSIAISNWTNSIDDMVDWFAKAAYLARTTASYDRANQPYPRWLQNELGQLQGRAEMSRHILDSKSMATDMNSLRVKLTQKYNKEFPPF